MNNNYTFYLPKVTPVATLLIVHGMAEHQGRYQPFAQFLANHDIAVLTFDHLGHGQQAYDNGCLGYIISGFHPEDGGSIPLTRSQLWNRFRIIHSTGRTSKLI